MRLFQSKATPFFLDKNAAPQNKGTFDVILSPQYYWIKKISLPVKRESEAKKLAESVFEGTLPAGHYSYDVHKAEDGEFIIIAYHKETISEALNAHFTGNAEVKNVYFAQYACKGLDACCSIDDDGSLVNLGGLLMQIPRNCTDPKLTMEQFLKETKINATPVKLGSLDEEVIDRRTFIYLAATLLLFLFALSVEYIDYRQAAKKVQDRKEALIAQYNLPATTMQLESIKKRLFGIYKNQKKMRDALYAFSKVTLGKNEHIKMLDLGDKEATIEIVLSSPEREALVKSQIAKKFKILESNLSEKILQIKVAI